MSRILTSSVDPRQIRIEKYYCEFWHLAAGFGAFDDSHIQRKVLPRLQKAFYILTERKDFFNAHSIANTYITCCSGRDKNSLVECIAANEQIPALYRAHAQLLLAKTMKSNGHIEKQDDLYALALKLYKDNNHSHGMLDTKIAMLCRLPLDSEDGSWDERLGSLFKQYEALNYPIGLSAALLKLLDFARDLQDINMESLVLDELEFLFPASSSRLIWLLTRIRALARRSLCGGDHGKIIQGAEALWRDLIESDCAWFRGQAARSLSQAYHAVNDQEMMIIWSQRAQNDLSQSKLTPFLSLTTAFDLNNFEGLSQCFQMIPALLNPKLSDYSPEAAAEKIEDFLSQADLLIFRDPRSWDIFENAVKLYEEKFTQIANMRLALVPLAQLRQAQANMLTFGAASRYDIDFELAALKPIKEARDYYLKAKEVGRAAMVLQHEALLNKEIAQKFERMGDPEVKLAWQNALNQYKTVLDSAITLSLTSLARENAYWVAFCEYKHWLHGWYSPEVLLQSLLLGENFIDQQRREVSVLRGMAAAVVKRRLSSSKKTRDIYRMAIDVCTGAKTAIDAWGWVQKSKARSLSDLLGLGILIPLELTERIQQDPACRQLFEDEHRLAKDLAAAPDTEQFKIRVKLESHQKRMREHAILAELLDLRDGVPIALNDLLISGQTQNRYNSKTVFVDWVATGSSLSIYVVKPGQKPILRKLPITVQSIDVWISKNLNSERTSADDTPRKSALSGLQEEDEENEGPLRDLDILVAPLAELSSPDDLLVLCPTGSLHAIPLHALRLGPIEDRQVLIERNPIVYCANLTSFIQCCRRADSSTSAIRDKRLLAVYEWEVGLKNGHRERSNDDERRQIYTSTDGLANLLKGEALCGENVTTQSFKESLEYAGLVHFFGHCEFAPEIVAEQSLCISGERGEGKEGERGKLVCFLYLRLFQYNYDVENCVFSFWPNLNVRISAGTRNGQRFI